MFPSLESILVRIKKVIESNEDVLKGMFKNTIPPTVALCVIQSTTLYDDFDTIGYLPVVISIIEAPMLPRVPFIKTMLFTCVLNSIVACAALLTGYCATQARLYTAPSGLSASTYNSSASVVSALWLFFIVWALQTFRAYQPQHMTSVIVCSIFSIASIVTSTRLNDMRAIINLNLQLLESFFLAHGLCTVTSLFIFPKTSRAVVMDDILQVLKSAQKVATCEKSFLDVLGSTTYQHQEPDATSHKDSDQASTADSRLGLASRFESVKSARTALSTDFAKLQADYSLAKRDVGWSGLTTSDLKKAISQLQDLMLSLRGMVALGSVFKAICEWRQWDINFEDDTIRNEQSRSSDADDVREQKEWGEIFQLAAESFSSIEQLVLDGLTHASTCLKQSDTIHFWRYVTLNTKIPTHDPEKTQQAMPGTRAFIGKFADQLSQLRSHDGTILKAWKQRDELGRVETREASFQRMLSHEHRSHPVKYQDRYYKEQQQLLIILYIENLIRKILDSLEEAVLFADERNTATETRGKSLIMPGKRNIWKLLSRFINDGKVEACDVMMGDEELPEAPHSSGTNKISRNGFEHLPPDTVLQGLGDRLGTAYGVIGSHQSFFGFRAACAVLSVTLIAFLRPTQTWFFNRRGIWAAVFIPFCMAPSSGEAFTLFLFRLIGTVMALVTAILNWYLGNGVPAAVIIWFFVITFIQQYFLIKLPQYAPIWRPSIITRAVIIGFELQIQHTNIPAPPATESQAYPVYLIGPYRFACVVIGVSVAFVWTIFPRSTTSGSTMRKRLGAAMFTLADYHSCMHSAVMSWARGHHTHTTRKGKRVPSAEYYRKAQAKLFSKETNLLTLIRSQARFSKFEPSLGGRFPDQHYKEIVRQIDLFVSYMNMVIFTATSLPLSGNPPKEAKLPNPDKHDATSMFTAQWTAGLINLTQACQFASTRVTTLLCLMASSIANQQPLPPDLRVPEPFYVAKQLQKLQPELMDLKNATEMGYSVFAVIEISTTMITQSLQALLDQVRDLAGELKFETFVATEAKQKKKARNTNKVT